MATLKKSGSAAMLAGGGGGSPEATQTAPRLASSQPGESPRPSSASAPATPSTRRGNPPSASGKPPVLTEAGSTTPNSTLVGTLNWVLTFLIRRGLVVFGLVRGANGEPEYYQARFPADRWEVRDTLLVLTEEME